MERSTWIYKIQPTNRIIHNLKGKDTKFKSQGRQLRLLDAFGTADYNSVVTETSFQKLLQHAI